MNWTDPLGLCKGKLTWKEARGILWENFINSPKYVWQDLIDIFYWPENNPEETMLFILLGEASFGRGALRQLQPNSLYPPNRGFLGEPTKATLKPGTLIDRYGSSSGSFTSPKGTPLSARSLPRGTEMKPFNTYRVIKPFEVDVGTTRPWYGQSGRGVQYDLGKSVQELIDSGYLEPIQ